LDNFDNIERKVCCKVSLYNEKRSYRRGTARRLKSVEILSAVAQLYTKNHI